MKGKKIVLGVVLTVSLTQIASLANTNNTIQNNIIDSQNLTNTINNSVTDNTTQNINNSNNTNSANNVNSVDNSTTTNNVAGENVTNNVTNNNNAISTFSIPQEESVNTTNEYQRVATRAEKTKENGIYKIAIGADLNKTIEVAGSDIGNNAKVDIWNYRKCYSTKILFKLR